MDKEVKMAIPSGSFAKEDYNDFFLVADIGGTNTTLAVVGILKYRSFDIIFRQRYHSFEIDQLHYNINDFLTRAYNDYGIGISRACFAIAGPTEPDRSSGKLTNLDLEININTIIRLTMLKSILLLNDLESIGYGIPLLDEDNPDQILQLRNTDGRFHERGFGLNMCIVAPGTGLGTSILEYDPKKKMYLPIASEAGHADFSATNDLEWDLLSYLRENVTGGVPPDYERVLSGKGIVNIYKFLCSRQKGPPDEILQMINSLDDREKPKAINNHISNSSICRQCMDVFIDSFARKSKDMALTTMAYGGVYLAGGIVPKIIDLLLKPNFMNMFESNDQLSHILHKIPVFVVRDYEVNLLGCANAIIHMKEKG